MCGGDNYRSYEGCSCGCCCGCGGHHGYHCSCGGHHGHHGHHEHGMGPEMGVGMEFGPSLMDVSEEIKMLEEYRDALSARLEKVNKRLEGLRR
jgi:hypothetical protein